MSNSTLHTCSDIVVLTSEKFVEQAEGKWNTHTRVKIINFQAIICTVFYVLARGKRFFDAASRAVNAIPPASI